MKTVSKLAPKPGTKVQYAMNGKQHDAIFVSADRHGDYLLAVGLMRVIVPSNTVKVAP